MVSIFFNKNAFSQLTYNVILFAFLNMVLYGNKQKPINISKSFKLFLIFYLNVHHKSNVLDFQNNCKFTFNEVSSLSIRWDPMEVKISKRYSFQTVSNYSKPVLNFIFRDKGTIWGFEILRILRIFISSTTHRSATWAEICDSGVPM